MGHFVKIRGNCEYIIMRVNYFTKWVEAKLMASITEDNAIAFLEDYIFCQFGLPRAVVSDHGTQFSKEFLACCERLMIKHWKSSVAYL